MISLLNYEFKKSMYPISILLTNFSILPLVHSSSQVIQNTSSDICQPQPASLHDIFFPTQGWPFHALSAVFPLMNLWPLRHIQPV